MTYQRGEADMGSLIIRALLFVFVFGVFVGGVVAAIWAIGEVFWPIGLHF